MIWERAQGRKQQQELLAKLGADSKKEGAGVNIVEKSRQKGSEGSIFSEHALQQRRVGAEEEIFFDDWRPESETDRNKENVRLEDTIGEVGAEVEDMVMKGVKNDRFGVPELALGGQVVGVSGESLVNASDEEWNEAASANMVGVKIVGKRVMTLGGEHVGEESWLCRLMKDLADEELGNIDF